MPSDRVIHVVSAHAEGEVGNAITGGVAPPPGATPRIKARAWITGTHQVLRDPADPWPEGYRLTDTWPAMPL